MIERSREWLAGLRQSVDDDRRRPGLAGPTGIDAIPAAQRAAERAILAAHLTLWIDSELPPEGDVRAIVVTTSPVGIDVASAVVGRDDPLMSRLRARLIALTEAEYRSWTKRHPDPDHQLHVNHWNWIKTRVPPARWPEFAAFPLGPGEHYWLHRTGTVGAGPEQRHCHLWKWNGATASLLKPFIAESVRRL